jgi:hypothetical protein
MVGKRPAPARTNLADRNPSGCGELPVDRVRVYLRQDLYTTVIISIPEGTNRSDNANHSTTVTDGEG